MFDATAGTIRDLVARLRGGDRDARAAPPATRRLNAVVMARLDLDVQPFRDDATADAMFIDDAVEMQLNMLTQQLNDGDMLPVLKGEAGSGKTSLLILLMGRSNERFHFFVARGHEALRAEQVMTEMLRLFTREVPEQMQQAFRELARHLRRLVADDCPAVLVVDDADALSDAQLNNLLAMRDSLAPALDGRFRLLFAAESDFELRLAGLDSEQLRAGRVIATGVRPMARPRIGAYLEQRLQAAGLRGDSPFGEEMLDRIAAHGGSLPRDIEAAAAAELNAGF
ncbi:MAG: ATP-binding protein [Halofilum sp. (in: g-proteobacteria)]|nr:ATP-binding protein [Halofilum sp. (in: g-proteobacteria)]